MPLLPVRLHGLPGGEEGWAQSALVDHVRPVSHVDVPLQGVLPGEHLCTMATLISSIPLLLGRALAGLLVPGERRLVGKVAGADGASESHGGRLIGMRRCV